MPIKPDHSAAVPCLADPTVAASMREALPCKCGSVRLLPVSDLDPIEPMLAVACNACGEIEGDAPSLKQAIANWNMLRSCQADRGSIH